jgi:carbonic anhydrase/acetyltransferase-like protein (isoleucine patch superfamily)
MGEGSIVDVDSFVMKGEVLEPYSVWRGNPAKLNRFVVPVDPQGVVLADVSHAGRLYPRGTTAPAAQKG